MAKVAVFFVSCKTDPEQKLQSWVPHLAVIYSQCTHCKTLTGYAQASKHDHYDYFEVVVKKERGMTYDDCYKRGEDLVNADKAKYKVDSHSNKMDLEGKIKLTKVLQKAK